MSRLARKPIKLPEGVTIAQNGDFLLVKGAKTERKVKLFPGIDVVADKGSVWVKFEAKRKQDKAILGTTWALVQNAIRGAKENFLKVLDIEGVGFRAQVEGKNLVLHLGYAVPVRLTIPEGVAVEIEKNTIKVSGADRALVGQVAADIRAYKKPEPYKGKGIRYRGEIVRRKAGKKAGAAAVA
ncbi:MAG: 50S ribosomal protein L6 [Patescibacteria group bacterium]